MVSEKRRSFQCGLASGVAQCVVFNPLDRAMYLSLKENRSIFSRLNWRNPYQGFMQAALIRTCSTGLYFPIESSMIRYISNKGVHNLLPGATPTLLGGLCAGTISAIALHPMAVVKHKCWGHDDAKLLPVFAQIWDRGRGLPVFLRGSLATIGRDSVFGACFASMRHWKSFHSFVDERVSTPLLPRSTGKTDEMGLRHGLTTHFICNFIAAGTAVAFASPFNYVRVIQFAVPNGQSAPSGFVIWRDVFRECTAEFERVPPRTGLSLNASFFPVRAAIACVTQRLRIGTGTLRVAVAMAFTSQLFRWCEGL